MGARGNIVLLDRADPGRRLYLYTHWRGRDLRGVLRDALRRAAPGERDGGRWSDASYLARVVFREMTRGEEDDLLGFGISLARAFPDYPELHVDVARGVVREVEVTLGERAFVEATLAAWSFGEFAEGDAPPARR